jgi:ankyrin repeat protein
MNWTEVCKTKDVEALRKAVHELDVNEQDERGRTPLMLLLTNRMPVEAVDLIIERGADLEIEDKLGDTALKKAVKFNQTDALGRLLEAGARLDSPQGIMGTAWSMARSRSKETADLLLATPGAVRLTLTVEEQEILDGILYEESVQLVCSKISTLDSPVLLHAVVNGYNWDDGPEPMLAVFHHSACLEITLLDMYELLDGDYWLEQEVSAESENDMLWRQLAEGLHERLNYA